MERSRIEKVEDGERIRRMAKIFCRKAEHYISTADQSPELAYLFANEALELLLGDSQGNVADAKCRQLGGCSGGGAVGVPAAEEKVAKAILRRALHTLLPVIRRLEKAAWLCDKAKLRLKQMRQEKKNSDPANYHREAIELLQQAAKLHATPNCLMEISNRYHSLKCYDLAYVYISEAMVAGGGSTTTSTNMTMASLQMSLLGDITPLSEEVLGKWRERRHAEQAAISSSSAVVASPWYTVNRWPTRLQLDFLSMGPGAYPTIRRSDGQDLQPLVPYPQLPAFLANNVASIDMLNLVGSVHDPLHPSQRPKEEKVVMDVLRSDAGVERGLSHCGTIVFANFFYFLSWAEVRLVLGVVAANSLCFINLCWNPARDSVGEGGVKVEEVNPDSLLEMPAARDCNDLYFIFNYDYLGDAVERGKAGPPIPKPGMVTYALTQVRFSSTALLAWLKGEGGASGKTESRGRKCTINDSHLKEGVAHFVQLFFRDFFDYPFATTAAAAAPTTISAAKSAFPLPAYRVELRLHDERRSELETCLEMVMRMAAAEQKRKEEGQQKDEQQQGEEEPINTGDDDDDSDDDARLANEREEDGVEEAKKEADSTPSAEEPNPKRGETYSLWNSAGEELYLRVHRDVKPSTAGRLYDTITLERNLVEEED